MFKAILKVGWPILALLLFTGVVIAERMGIGQTSSAYTSLVMDKESLEFTPDVVTEKESLIVFNSSDEIDEIYIEDAKFVLDSMRIGYDVIDLKTQKISDINLDEYKTLVSVSSDLSYYKDDLLKVCDWIERGGRMMNTTSYTYNTYFEVIYGKLGVKDMGQTYVGVGGMVIDEDFMVGAKDLVFNYDEASLVALNVDLDEKAKVHIKEKDSGTPLLWEHDYGRGKFVVINQAISGKPSRGILAAAYSLLQDYCVYPVINGSAFYIDDFPSPLPQGRNKFIEAEYSMSIAEFYLNVWWPQFLQWHKQYGLRYTGLTIEDYTDVVKPPFKEQLSTQRFKLLGNMLLNTGGEIGIHGYNHMPLYIKGFDDYKGLYSAYRLWPDEASATAALKEVLNFNRKLFGDLPFDVYVPPSNILSMEGRRILMEACPNIKQIASTYNAGPCAYTQEFMVSDDGMIETPRIVSGLDIDAYMQLMAFSELNFHYVQSHFTHPDDILDEDRGGNLGWKTLTKRFSQYLDWLYTSVPNIRNVTGSQMGTAVLQYDRLTVNTEATDDKITIHLGGFSGQAYLMMRMNKKEISTIEGGEYEHLGGNLYLIHAKEDKVVIS